MSSKTTILKMKGGETLWESLICFSTSSLIMYSSMPMLCFAYQNHTTTTKIHSIMFRKGLLLCDLQVFFPAIVKMIPNRAA